MTDQRRALTILGRGEGEAYCAIEIDVRGQHATAHAIRTTPTP